MGSYHSQKSDFSRQVHLSSQKSLVERMLVDIDEAGGVVQAEGLSYLYVPHGEASLGAGKTSQRFVEATTRVQTMLSSAANLHKEVLQNIDSKLVKGLDEAFESLNLVNGKENRYQTMHTYERTQTLTSNYTTANGYYSQTITKASHYSLDEILDGEKTPLQVVKVTYANRVKAIRGQIAHSDKLTADKIKEIESMSDEELIAHFYPRLKAEQVYSKIRGSTYQEVHKGSLTLLDVGLNLLAVVGMIGGVALSPFTGGSSLYVTYAAGTYLAGSSAYSAITGNTLITGERLSPLERTFAGIEAVTTVLSLGGTAVGSSGLKVGSQTTKVLTTLGNVADKTDDVMDVVQLGYGISQGEGESALMTFALGKGVSMGTKAAFGQLTKHLSVEVPTVQLNARQGQEFLDLQTVEFGKVATNVENHITIQLTVDGVERKVRVDAIGFDETGTIRIQEYTTAQHGLKVSRAALLQDLSQYGGTIVGAGKGDFVGGVDIPKGTRIDVVSQKTGTTIIESPVTSYTVDDFKAEMEQLPHIDLSKKVEDGLISTKKGERPSPHYIYSADEIKAHLAMFDEGAVKLQSYSDYQLAVKNYNGIIGPEDGHYVMPKFVYEKAVEASDGDPRILEELLGLEEGYLGDNPVVIDIKHTKNLRMPSGNERGAWQGFWEPGGYTQGGLPEAVIDQLKPEDYSVNRIFN